MPLGAVADLIAYYPQNERDNPAYRTTPIRILVDTPVGMDYTSTAAITKEGTVEIYIVDKNFMDFLENFNLIVLNYSQHQLFIEIFLTMILSLLRLAS